MIRVHVVCWETAIREAICDGLDCEPDLTVVGRSVKFWGASKDPRPDILVACPEPSGTLVNLVNLCRAAAPGAKVVLLFLGGPPSGSSDAGADAVAGAEGSLAELVATVRRVGGSP